MRSTWADARELALAVSALGDSGTLTSRLVRLAPAATGTMVEAVCPWVVVRAWIHEPVPRELYVPRERLPELWEEVAGQAVEPDGVWPDTNAVFGRWQPTHTWGLQPRGSWYLLHKWARWSGQRGQPLGLVPVRVSEGELQHQLHLLWPESDYLLRGERWLAVGPAEGDDAELGVFQARLLAAVWGKDWQRWPRWMRTTPGASVPLFLGRPGMTAAVMPMRLAAL